MSSRSWTPYSICKARPRHWLSGKCYNFGKACTSGHVTQSLGRVDVSDVSFSCVSPVIDHEFRRTIVKVDVDSRVDLQTTLEML